MSDGNGSGKRFDDRVEALIAQYVERGPLSTRQRGPMPPLPDGFDLGTEDIEAETLIASSDLHAPETVAMDVAEFDRLREVERDHRRLVAVGRLFFRIEGAAADTSTAERIRQRAYVGGVLRWMLGI